MNTITILNFLNASPAIAAVANQKVNLVRLMLVIAVLCSGFSVVAQNGMATTGHYFCAACQPEDDDDPITSSVNKDLVGVTPFASGYHNQKSQYIYLASELTDSPNAASEGPITSVAFYVTKLPNNAPFTLTNYSVKIGHTSFSRFVTSPSASNGQNFGASFGFDDAVETAVGDVTITQTGWYTLEFAEPFMWDGESNIIIEVCKSNSSVATSFKNYEVRTTQYTDNDYYKSRAFHTINPNSSTHPVAGCDMKKSTMGAPNNFNVIGSTSMKFRPDARFQFGCTGASNPGVASIVGAVTSSGCSEVTMAVTNGAQNSGLTFQWVYADNINMIGAQPVPGDSNSETLKVTQLPVDRYYRRITNCGGSFTNSAPKLVPAAPVNTYNGSSWSNGTPTDASNRRLVVNGNLSLAANVRACGCEIKPGVSVTVNSGSTLTVDSNIDVRVGGSLTFEDGSALIQKDSRAVNTGNIIYKRVSQPLLKFDFTYWSSPVTNQTLFNFSPETRFDKYMSFNHVTQSWVVENSANPMVAGRGYIIRAPETFNTTGAQQVFNSAFIGTPNNGDITVNVATGTGKYNLIGNPYPSAVDAASFYAANSSKLEGTFYFWTHHTPVTGMNYNSNDYAVMNLMGDVVASPNSLSPNGMIGAGQSIMIKGKTGAPVGTDTVVFTNDMRRGAIQNAVFFKESVSSTGPVAQNINEQKHRVWLDLRNGQGYKQLLVGYTGSATSGYDPGIDGEAIAGSVLSFYSLLGTQKLAIQGLSFPFSTTEQVPLGFTTTVAGNQTLSLSKFDGVFSDHNILLEDKLLNVIHDLKSSPYTFASAAGTINNRFVLRYDVATSNVGSSLAVLSTEAASESVVIFMQNKDLRIDGGSVLIDTVKVYDLSGRLLSSHAGYNSNEVVLANPNWSSQVLIVQLTTADNTIITKKVVY